MGKGRKVLSDDHARALIKQALGMIFGDTQVEADATTEIDTIEAQHTTTPRRTAIAPRPRPAPRTKTPQA